jgi:hypothetical protein
MHDSDLSVGLYTYEDRGASMQTLASIISTKTDVDKSQIRKSLAYTSQHYSLAFSSALPGCQIWTSGNEA